MDVYKQLQSEGCTMTYDSTGLEWLISKEVNGKPVVIHVSDRMLATTEPFEWYERIQKEFENAGKLSANNTPNL